MRMQTLDANFFVVSSAFCFVSVKSEKRFGSLHPANLAMSTILNFRLDEGSDRRSFFTYLHNYFKQLKKKAQKRDKS